MGRTGVGGFGQRPGHRLGAVLLRGDLLQQPPSAGGHLRQLGDGEQHPLPGHLVGFLDEGQPLEGRRAGSRWQGHVDVHAGRSPARGGLDGIQHRGQVDGGRLP